MIDELDALPESVAPQRWHATGDYAYPAEERDDGEFVDYDDYARLSARVQELERENEELRSVCEEAELNREGIKIAHKELAAIKKRIAEAPHVTLALANGDDLLILSAERADDWAGKCCALLPLDDEAKS